MSSAAFIAFALCFVAGPLAYALLLRLVAGLTARLALALAVVASALLALVLQPSAPASSLALMWFAWVLAVAMMALTLRRHVTAPAPRRAIAVLGLCATPLPWFGLATARMMTS